MAEAPLTGFRLDTFKVGELRLTAKRWGNPGGRRVIALHGWLDNCASFDNLAQQLPEFDFICLDCAGHGRSDHRPHFGAYNIWQDVLELFAVADQLNWQQFDLLGHSRGAMIAFLAAGTFPERIGRLTLIEAVYPRVAQPELAPEQLAEAYTTLKFTSRRVGSYYTSFDKAVLARTKGAFPLGIADAEALAVHGVQKSAKGYRWQYDPKLLAASEVRFSKAQIDAFSRRIQAKWHLILSDERDPRDDPQLAEWLERHTDLRLHYLPGGHHLHMHPSSGKVAALMRDDS